MGHTVVNVDGGGLNENDESEEEDGGFGEHYKKGLVWLCGKDDWSYEGTGPKDEGLVRRKRRRGSVLALLAWENLVLDRGFFISPPQHPRHLWPPLGLPSRASGRFIIVLTSF